MHTVQIISCPALGNYIVQIRQDVQQHDYEGVKLKYDICAK